MKIISRTEFYMKQSNKFRVPVVKKHKKIIKKILSIKVTFIHENIFIYTENIIKITLTISI